MAINATLLGNAAQAKFNRGSGFVIGQGGFLDGEKILSYGNQDFGFDMNNCQAFLPNARGWKNIKGRMQKMYSWIAIR